MPNPQKTKLLKTKNDLPEPVRQAIVAVLNDRLADAIDLGTQCKQAHWNVKGPNFIALHKLFDEVNEAVEEYVDELAERTVQLGGIALGTARHVAQQTSLSEYPLTLIAGADHIEALSDSLAAFGKLSRQAIETSTQKGDADTADLFTEISRGIDKWIWMIEAHQIKIGN